MTSSDCSSRIEQEECSYHDDFYDFRPSASGSRGPDGDAERVPTLISGKPCDDAYLVHAATAIVLLTSMPPLSDLDDSLRGRRTYVEAFLWLAAFYDGYTYS